MSKETIQKLISAGFTVDEALSMIGTSSQPEVKEEVKPEVKTEIKKQVVGSQFTDEQKKSDQIGSEKLLQEQLSAIQNQMTALKMENAALKNSQMNPSTKKEESYDFDDSLI